MTDRLRFGILATGNIANQFARDIPGSERCIVTAIGSRTLDNARAFAEKHRIANAHASYEDVIDDPDVDAIYNNLPNAMHHEWTIKALAAGKHVLCEKPIATNAMQAEEMFAAAGRYGRVLVEAFMYRSHPMIKEIVRKVREGVIGEVGLIRASFSFKVWNTDANTRFSTQLAGGAFMDIGCYCIDFASMIAGGHPQSVEGFAHLHPSGIDDFGGAVMQFENGVVATFTSGMTIQADNTTSICGTDGYIEIPIPWKPPVTGAQYTIGHSTPPKMDGGKPTSEDGEPRQTFTVDAGKPLYALEADDFASTVLDGAAPVITAEQTIATMRVLDELRQECGVPVV